MCSLSLSLGYICCWNRHGRRNDNLEPDSPDAKSKNNEQVTKGNQGVSRGQRTSKGG